MLPLAAAPAVAVVAAIVWLGRRSDALGRVAAVALAVTAVTWIAALAVISTGWNDADGFADCNDYCHGWHYVGGFLFVTPLLAGLLLVAVLVIAGLNRIRLSRRSARKERRDAPSSVIGPR